MAEMDTSSGGGHKKGPGVKKGKKLSTRVDLTPMVDLGFLLITFFIFTTTMSEPTAMRLFLPKDTEKPEDQNKVKASGALSIMLGKDNQIFYYAGELLPDGSNFKSATFKEIRQVIIDKKKTTNPEDFVVVIKPGPESTYKNTVDMLDEMAINEVKRYALVDIFDQELALMAASQK
ncbi:ExbD/TolR family protein [Pseudobacter ginsenosidimutans]|uniref:Outer membrane transport energization protein ExbD n=1 Tax=Pseudobacter ginsenosidimutans TaxID=661488 RepID=A0A4V2F166_9BACT|nr:biopolymer transporter ExbD [Pseudobacter ginsenosidimutans]RZS72561.1 outer membrane transport energization protein ExbD [Pseudobacter ginsenosidimutans]